MQDELGDRMKQYESLTKSFLMNKTYTIIRVDGKAFHTFTRQCGFDSILFESNDENLRDDFFSIFQMVYNFTYKHFRANIRKKERTSVQVSMTLDEYEDYKKKNEKVENI